MAHWVTPRMPPRFSFNIDLTSNVNAPLLRRTYLIIELNITRVETTNLPMMDKT
jgi:hypothetical protein